MWLGEPLMHSSNFTENYYPFISLIISLINSATFLMGVAMFFVSLGSNNNWRIWTPPGTYPFNMMRAKNPTKGGGALLKPCSHVCVSKNFPFSFKKSSLWHFMMLDGLREKYRQRFIFLPFAQVHLCSYFLMDFPFLCAHSYSCFPESAY